MRTLGDATEGAAERLAHRSRNLRNFVRLWLTFLRLHGRPPKVREMCQAGAVRQASANRVWDRMCVLRDELGIVEWEGRSGDARLARGIDADRLLDLLGEEEAAVMQPRCPRCQRCGDVMHTRDRSGTCPVCAREDVDPLFKARLAYYAARAAEGRPLFDDLPAWITDKDPVLPSQECA